MNYDKFTNKFLTLLSNENTRVQSMRCSRPRMKKNDLTHWMTQQKSL